MGINPSMGTTPNFDIPRGTVSNAAMQFGGQVKRASTSATPTSPTPEAPPKSTPPELKAPGDNATPTNVRSSVYAQNANPLPKSPQTEALNNQAQIAEQTLPKSDHQGSKLQEQTHSAPPHATPPIAQNQTHTAPAAKANVSTAQNTESKSSTKTQNSSIKEHGLLIKEKAVKFAKKTANAPFLIAAAGYAGIAGGLFCITGAILTVSAKTVNLFGNDKLNNISQQHCKLAKGQLQGAMIRAVAGVTGPIVGLADLGASLTGRDVFRPMRRSVNRLGANIVFDKQALSSVELSKNLKSIQNIGDHISMQRHIWRLDAVVGQASLKDGKPVIKNNRAETTDGGNLALKASYVIKDDGKIIEPRKTGMTHALTKGGNYTFSTTSTTQSTENGVVVEKLKVEVDNLKSESLKNAITDGGTSGVPRTQVGGFLAKILGK